jgi:small GTP-binding protein
MLARQSPLRVVAIGASSVGKTSLVSAAMERPFKAFEQNTVGANWHLYATTVDGAPFQLQIWDTAGQERYRALGPLYYRHAAAALAVFDLTSRESFVALPGWVGAFHAVAGPAALVFVVGNKGDLADNRQVAAGEALEWAAGAGRNYPYCETSAKTGQGVAALFQAVADAVARMPRRRLSESQADAGDGCRC